MTIHTYNVFSNFFSSGWSINLIDNVRCILLNLWTITLIMKDGTEKKLNRLANKIIIVEEHDYIPLPGEKNEKLHCN